MKHLPKVSVLIILFFFHLACYGQKDINTLLGYPENDWEAILRGRDFLYKHLTVKDTQKVAVVFNYVTSLENEDLLSFYPEEYQLFSYWMMQHKQVLNYAAGYDSVFIKKLMNKKLFPSEFQMPQLIDFMYDQKDVVYSQIENNTDLTATEKVFLRLNLEENLLWGSVKHFNPDSLKPQLRKFKNDNPESRFIPYVDKKLETAIVDKHWILSGEFTAGLGFKTGPWGQTFGPLIPFGAVFEFRYRQFALKWFNILQLTWLRDTLNNNDIHLSKGVACYGASPAVSLGYYIKNDRALKICPFAGWSYFGISPFKSEERGGNIFSLNGFNAGLSFDFFLKEENSSTQAWIYKDDHYFRVTYQFVKPFIPSGYTGVSGSMHNITIGYVMQSHAKKILR
ncbi:MAG: hypothetical protein JNL60_09815 [Bacteroidia bacterium]|nr:hypothetical protein [Bacteroidia bacterium]